MSWTVFPLSPPARTTQELGEPSPLKLKPSERTEDVQILPWPPSATARRVTERAKCPPWAAAPQWWAARAAWGDRAEPPSPCWGGLGSSAPAPGNQLPPVFHLVSAGHNGPSSWRCVLQGALPLSPRAAAGGVPKAGRFLTSSLCFCLKTSLGMQWGRKKTHPDSL